MALMRPGMPAGEATSPRGRGGGGGVALIDRACAAAERDGSVAGQMGGGGKGECLIEGEVLRVEVELVVGAPGCGRSARAGYCADGHLAVAYLDVADGEVGNYGVGFF